MTHIQGPWEVAGPSQNGHCRRIFAGAEFVAFVGASDQPMKTIRANADLIAAAPEMFEALKRVRQDLIAQHSPSQYVTNFAYIDNAIAKAETFVQE